LENRPASRLVAWPTARGWQALVIGVAVVVLARLIGTTQFHQLAYVLLGLVAAAAILGYLSTARLRFSRGLSPGERLVAGAPSRVRLELSNESPLGTQELEVTDHLPQEQSFESPPLGQGESRSTEVEVTFARRGIYSLGPATARSTDPFGLLRFVRRFGQRTEAVVYPEVRELANFPLGGGDAEAGTVGALGRQGDEFAGLREYRRGDDRRHIHWKSLARTGELFVKEFSMHAPRRYTVALDLRRAGLRAPEREVEDAVSAAASVLSHLFRERLPGRLLCTDSEGSATPFGSDERSYWRAMRLLATVRSDGGDPVGEVLTDKLAGARDELGEGVVLIHRSPDEDLVDPVRRLRAANLSVVVVALATHTYRGYPRSERGNREAAFSRFVGALEAAGASVRVMRHPEGLEGFAGDRRRERVG
jgi:uncharacterized protein (DUF58 family)